MSERNPNIHRNPMPELHLFPRAEKVIDFFSRLLIHPNHTLSSHGDHFNHGGGPMLDRELRPGEVGSVIAFPGSRQIEIPFDDDAA